MTALLDQIKTEVQKLEGPIVVFGAGGFIGSNLFRHILKYREDVYAVTSTSFVPWRIDDLRTDRIIQTDITDKKLCTLYSSKISLKLFSI